jgi:hypothetical protein
MRKIGRFVRDPSPLAAMFTLMACASTRGNSASIAPALGDIRGLTLVPAAASACPGEVITARYLARLADGSRVQLRGADASALVRTGTAVQPQGDATWLTTAEPLASAATGFRLTASLATDSTIRADTVVAPKYECLTPTIELSAAAFQNSAAYVRLGTFHTPFFDSIVVAVVEGSGLAPIARILSPSQLKPGAIRINVPGLNGRAGRPGRNGQPGSECSDGSDGEDGEPGGSGEPGGRVDIIVQSDAPWLAQLVAVSNPGGHGGAGGRGGTGGARGVQTRRSSGACPARAGRPGKPGLAGPSAAAGPSPNTTSVIYSLLWSGSPIWSIPEQRRAIEALIAYDDRIRR